jgi:hypothetical protein
MPHNEKAIILATVIAAVSAIVAVIAAVIASRSARAVMKSGYAAMTSAKNIWRNATSTNDYHGKRKDRLGEVRYRSD